MNIGLVLSGGGIRGIAHVGAIKALEEHGISISHISGTSAGAIVGALYAHGYNYEEMMSFFRRIQIFDIKKFAINKPGFIDSEKYYDLFNEYFPVDNFNCLKKSLTVTATDILNGKLATFSEGELIKPLIASAAFPGVFAPIKIADSYYIDGGTLDNFPVDHLADSCMRIIGIYVNPFKKVSFSELKHFHNILERAFKLKSIKEDILKFDKCDLIVCPEDLGNYGTFDKKHLDDIFEIGYNYTRNKLLKNTVNFYDPDLQVI
jgi:NTE family protein